MKNLKLCNLDVALASLWHLARHWQQGEAAKLEMSGEAGSLNIQLNPKLGHPLHNCAGKSAGVMQLKQM